MPDYTLCKGINCDVRDRCFRFRAKPSRYQSYFVTTPGINKGCVYFMSLQNWPISMLKGKHNACTKK